MMRLIIVIVIAALLAGLWMFWPGDAAEKTAASSQREPLYWVAPMDPGYRRDAPGKSPMGMDLVPVYLEDLSASGQVAINPAMQQNMGVRTAEVKEGYLKDSIKSVGYIALNEARLWHAYPRVEGWIDRLNVTYEGETVAAGQVLFEIYSPQLTAAQEEYLSALQGGNTTLIKSVEARLRTLDVPDATLRRVAETREVARTVSVLSPMTGVVTKLAVRAGHFVRPGTPVLEVAGLEDVWVTVAVPESAAAFIQPDSHMHLTFDALGGEIRHTTVDFMSPILDGPSRTLIVRGTLQNKDGKLRPDMFTEAQIDVPNKKRSLLIPRSALIETATSRRVVLVTGSETFKSVAVETGQRSAGQVEINSGLKAGDRVVTSAQFLIDSESMISSDLQRMGLEVDMDHGDMDHGDMDHGDMDHGDIGHGDMGHGDMDHGDMDHVDMDHGDMDHGDMDHRTMNHRGDGS